MDAPTEVLHRVADVCANSMSTGKSRAAKEAEEFGDLSSGVFYLSIIYDTSACFDHFMHAEKTIIMSSALDDSPRDLECSYRQTIKSNLRCSYFDQEIYICKQHIIAIFSDL